MTRTAIALLSILLCAVTLCVAADNPAVGKWSCVSTDARGTEVAWTLVVTQEAGKLSGSITILQTGDQVAILGPALNGNVFTFKIPINAEEIVELSGRIEGSKIEGSSTARIPAPERSKERGNPDSIAAR
jgi:hypothetical protein